MLACSSRGALPAAPAARQSRPVRRIVAAASPAAVLGSRGSVAARLAQQLRQLKQFKVWDVSAAPSDRCTPDARGGRQLRPARQGAPNDGGARPGAGGGRRPGIVWFRGDLRLHDNDALSRAQADCSSLLPVYCFDPRDYGKSPQGYDRTGPFRAQFLQEAVADLRAALRAAGSELIVRLGKPEEVIGELVRRTGAGAVYCHTEVTYEERRVEAAVKAAAEGAGAQLRAFWGATLAHLEDLPFKLDQLPQSFDGFRERTAGVSPRAALPTPGELRGLPLGGRVDAGEIPTLQQLGLAPLPKGAAPSGSASSSRGSGSGQAKGGEGEALSQLRRFLAHAAGGSGSGSKAAAGAAYTSNFASCIAPWLATGCLSPRRMLEEAQQALGGSGSSAQATAAAASAAQPSGAQAPLSWVRYELLWRDFFRATLRLVRVVCAVWRRRQRDSGSQGRKNMSARLSLEDGVAVVTLDNAPVNALTPAVLDSLFDQLRKAQRNPDVKAIVLTGVHGKFCAGFDFTLYGTPQMSAILDTREEALKEMGALLENGPKPTVAAVEGACLGGGCELAMACSARVSAKGAQLGLPEVRLGLLPGLGGTQRMPRLVGMDQALNLMLSAAAVSADDALSIGLVDEVVPSADLMAAARAAALELAAGSRPRRRTLQLTHHMPASGEGFVAAGRAIQDAQAQVSRKFAGQPHLDYLLEAAAAGLVQGAGAGLQKEGEGFRAAASSRMHRLTLHFFKATRSLKRAPGPLRLLIQAYLFLGLVFMYFYVRLAYIKTSFMRGYDLARKKGDKKGSGSTSSASTASGSGAGGSKAAAAGARKKK